MDGEAPITMPAGTDDSPACSAPWTRGVAAGSLLVGALLLAGGRRRSGVAFAAAGAAVALLEDPQAVRNSWNAIPGWLRAGQDFLVRMEDFVDELNKQAVRLRDVVDHSTSRG